MLVADATHPRGPRRDQRLSELAADPIFGEQVADADHRRRCWRCPTRTWPRRWSRSTAASAATSASWPSGSARAWPTGGLPAAFAVADTVAQIDGLLATPVADDPLLHDRARHRPGWTSTAGRPGCATVIETDVRPGMAAYRDVLRDEVLPVARPDERCGLSWLPDGDDDVRRDAALLHHHDQVGPGDPRHRAGADREARRASTARSGPRSVGTDDLEQIFEAMRTDPALHFEHR